MKTLSLLLIFSSFWTFGQQRQYATKNYSDYLIKLGEKERPILENPKDIKLPVTITLTFILLSKDVSRDQLTKQIQTLNQDFSNKTFVEAENQNQHYKNLATDTDIRFCENFETIQAFTDQKIDFQFALEQAKKHKIDLKFSVPVFVCDLDLISGFAQKVGYSTESDAIFVNKNYLVGSATKGFELGKTLTHLMGSFLGLGELWNCEDDGIMDTPLMSAEHFMKESGWSSCYSYVVQTMPENFMYNTQDKYLNMFTLGQKERMHQVLASEKAYLLESTTCK